MAGNTPKKDYPQPEADIFGNIYRDIGERIGGRTYNVFDFAGPRPMGRSPRELGLYVPDAPVTPQANPAAVRAYTRNAPYMEEFMSDPQAMISEMRNLQQMLDKNPNDPVSEYRFRILRQALGDVFGMQAPDTIGYTSRPSAPVTPSDFDPGYTTPKSPPTMPQTMARRGR